MNRSRLTVKTAAKSYRNNILQLILGSNKIFIGVLKITRIRPKPSSYLYHIYLYRIEVFEIL